MFPYGVKSNQIADVFQSLSILIHKTTPPPDEIRELLKEYHKAQMTFIKGLYIYMHKKDRNVNEVSTLQCIIQHCPQLLKTKDVNGNLPIHNTIQGNTNNDENIDEVIIPMLIKAGIKYKVGGSERGRGGLLVKGSGGRMLIHSIMMNRKNSNLIKALSVMSPPPLHKEDVTHFRLLPLTVDCGNMEGVKWIIRLNSNELFRHVPGRRKNNNNHDNSSSASIVKHCLPIEFSKSLNMAMLLFQSAIEYFPNHESIGGLFAPSNYVRDGLIIDWLVQCFGREKTWKKIEQVLSMHQQKDICILHKVIVHAPRHIGNVMSCFPDACFLRDKNGRLPIHVALNNGMIWSVDLVSIMNANLRFLGECDPLTTMCLGALAAAEPSCDLRTIHYLIRKYPESIKKRKHF